MSIIICLLLIANTLVITGGADENITITITYYGPDWDITHDGICDTYDVSSLVGSYGDTGDPHWIRQDINRDGVVDTYDVSLIVAHYGDTWLE